MNKIIGIEDINAYCGPAFIDVKELFEQRELDLSRFDNLMMQSKSVSFPCEDVVSYAVNAAKPIIEQLSDDEKQKIDMIITSTESGVDFGKSVSTYIHHYLNLHNKCRLFEVKQACYGGTAALQMAMSYVMAAPNDRKVLVIATDESRVTARLTYAEPSQGVSSIAMLVGTNPKVLTVDWGANGFCGYEIMDTCRPESNIETGDADLSLFSYIDCLEKAYQNYTEKVEQVDLVDSFSHLVFHTPFAGMVKGAHRKLLRQVKRLKPAEIDTIFEWQIKPSLAYCQQVGNAYSASIYLALCGLIDHIRVDNPLRIGLYSYGSGCSSEFYSGIVNPSAKAVLANRAIQDQLNQRIKLDIASYDEVLNLREQWKFGVRDKICDVKPFQELYNKAFEGKRKLILENVENYHRTYRWS